jgi:FkbM family methyltransferase
MLMYGRKLIRTAQTSFPAAVDFRFRAQNIYYRLTKRLFKPDFLGATRFRLDQKLIIDIGAYRGQSIISFMNTIDRPRIIAFEANPTLAKGLQSEFAKDKNIAIYDCALGENDQEAILYIPYYKGYILDGIASLHYEAAADWPNSDRFYFFDKSKLEIKRRKIKIRTLDSFELHPALIKLHAQRHEIKILHGATETIKISRPIILAAWTWPELNDYLSNLGYERFAFVKGEFIRDKDSTFNWFLLKEHKVLI